MNREGYFWFPDDDTIKFKGKVESEKSPHIQLEITSFNDSMKIQQTERDQRILIHGVLENSLAATFVVSLSNKKENYNFADNTYLLKIVFEILVAYYGEHFKTIDDIKFNAIVIAFQNLDKWITYRYSIYHFNNSDHKKTVKIDSYIVEIYYKSPISERDLLLINEKSFDKVLYVEIKSPKRMNLEGFQDIKNALQDFFNFFITTESVIVNSIYGTMSENKNSKYIAIESESYISDKMNKSKVISPFLKSYSEINGNFEKLFQNFYEFRKKGKVAYNYYFDEMYQDLPLEVRLLLLCNFLEAYHAIYLMDRSRKREENKEKLREILSRVSTADLGKDDKDIISASLKQFYNKATLTERLKEIFLEYGELIALSSPLLSLLSEKELESSINTLGLEQPDHFSIMDIIKNKKNLDLKTIEGKERYDKLLQELLQKENQKIASMLLEYTTEFAVGVLAKEISRARNMITHVIQDSSVAQANVWYYFVKCLEIISQLCILTQIGFTKQQLSEMFFINKMPFRGKLEVIICSSITAGLR